MKGELSRGADQSFAGFFKKYQSTCLNPKMDGLLVHKRGRDLITLRKNKESLITPRGDRSDAFFYYFLISFEKPHTKSVVIMDS